MAVSGCKEYPDKQGKYSKTADHGNKSSYHIAKQETGDDLEQYREHQVDSKYSEYTAGSLDDLLPQTIGPYSEVDTAGFYIPGYQKSDIDTCPVDDLHHWSRLEQIIEIKRQSHTDKYKDRDKLDACIDPET